MTQILKIARAKGADPLLPLPSYQTAGAAGMDIVADTSRERLIVKPNQRLLVKTGLCFEIPTGYEVQIRPRSGLALKHGVTLVNAPGTIDSDYRGEVGVILINFGNTDFQINHGDRIAQMVFASVIRCGIVETEILSETKRNQSGFGSTGSR
ncbi:MAG: dUTP diphosphatase [Rhodobacteraceae bacterium]|nr:dUTP diphosphatase [Paracoccaceae bacterium]